MGPLDPLTLRAVVMGVPLLATLALWAARPPRGADLTGMLLATAWQLPPLLLLNALAPHLGWWSFSADGGLWMGVPLDLLVGWAFLWGALPALLPRHISPVFIGLGAFCFDLLVIPLCRPIIDLAGWQWLLGEALCIAVALMPGLALARWTAERRNLVARAVLQAVGFGGLFLLVLPAAVQAASGLGWDPLLVRPAAHLFVFGQFLFVFAGWGVRAAQEFALRGQGTPLPQDPTQRLVTSGPYAYVSNPMQLSTCLVLLTLAVGVESAPLAGAAAMVVVFSVGLGSWQEGLALNARFGAPYAAWRSAVRPWLPRWRPWVPFAATLYYAQGCGPCEAVATFIGSRNPVGLALVPAQEHPNRDLSRLTYAPGDGGPEEDGVAAFARALEHTNLLGGLLASLMRLPIVLDLLQVLVDASGGGPRVVLRRPADQKPNET